MAVVYCLQQRQRQWLLNKGHVSGVKGATSGSRPLLGAWTLLVHDNWSRSRRLFTRRSVVVSWFLTIIIPRLCYAQHPIFRCIHLPPARFHIINHSLKHLCFAPGSSSSTRIDRRRRKFESVWCIIILLSSLAAIFSLFLKRKCLF